MGVAISREAHTRLKLAAQQAGVTPSVYLREMLNTSLNMGGPPFSRGWIEGYRAAFASVMAAFQSTIGAERERYAADNDLAGFSPDGFPPE
jgi:hypothetical protein